MLASGRRLPAAKIVLATGLARNESGFAFRQEVRSGGRYIGDPWAANAYEAIDVTGDLAIIGSGLTMLDVVISLEKRGFRGRYFVFSRRGLLVRSRREVEAWPFPGATRELAAHRPLFAAGNQAGIARDLGGRGTIGSAWSWPFAPLVEALWAGADDAERRRFARHLRSFWDLAFHRAVPESIAWLDRVRGAGTFRQCGGTRAGIGGGRRARHCRDVAATRRRAKREPPLRACRECGGLRCGLATLAGAARPQPPGQGTGPAPCGRFRNRCRFPPATGAAIGADGRPSRRLFAVGHPLRGAAWGSELDRRADRRRHAGRTCPFRKRNARRGVSPDKRVGLSGPQKLIPSHCLTCSCRSPSKSARPPDAVIRPRLRT